MYQVIFNVNNNNKLYRSKTFITILIATLLLSITNTCLVRGDSVSNNNNNNNVNNEEQILPMAKSYFFSERFNNEPSDADFVEDPSHQIWYIEGNKRRLVGSYQLLLDLLKQEKKIESDVLQVRKDILSTTTVAGANMYINSNEDKKIKPTFAMNQTIPFHPNFSIQYSNPFNYGYDSTMFFQIWFFEPPTNGHQAIFHSLPSVSETLSVVLFAMPGSVPSKYGNGKKISLFLGVCHSKVSTANGIGSTTSNIEMKGTPFSNAVDAQQWNHVSITFTHGALTLYVNGKPGASFNVSKFGLSGVAGGAKGKISSKQRAISFGRFENQNGFSGLISKGKAVFGWKGDQHDINDHMKQTHMKPIPRWLCDLVKIQGIKNTEVFEKARKALIAENIKSNANENDQNVVTESNSADTVDNLDSFNIKNRDSLFDFGRAFASLTSIGHVNDDWRSNTIKKYVKILHLQKEQSQQEYAKWFETPPKKKISESFKTQVCIEKKTGWWNYNYCYLSTTTQIHESNGNNDKKIVYNLGHYYSADKPIIQIDPSDLHIACKEERKLGCPNLLFEDTVLMIDCLYSKIKEVYMQGRCKSLVSRLKKEPLMISHSHKNGDKCDNSKSRMSDIKFECCPERSDHKLSPTIRNVVEPSDCNYVWTICIPLLCKPIFFHNYENVVDDSSSIHAKMPLQVPPKSSGFDNQNRDTGNTNIFLKSIVTASSAWNSLQMGKKAIDGKLKTEWKSQLDDTNPTIEFELKEPCINGVKQIEIFWSLAPAAFTIYTSKDGLKFDEVTSMATQPEMGRVDVLEGWALPNEYSVTNIRIIISDIGTYTANSIKEIVGICKNSKINISPKVLADKANSENIDSRMRLENTEIRHGNGLMEVEAALERLEDGERDFDLAHTIWMLQFITKPKRNIKAPNNRHDESFKKSLHALAYNVLKGNQWPSNRFQHTDINNGNSNKNEGNNIPQEQSSSLHIVDEINHNKPSFYLEQYDVELAAQLYHETALIVIGPDHAMKQPKPAEKIYLSKATKEQLKQHAGEDGDVAVYQKDKAEAGDRHARMWMESRYYHGLNGFELDRERAANIFREVADGGDAEAAYNFGVMRLNGQDGQPPDRNEANRYFNMATAHSFSPALNGIGAQHMQKAEYEKAFSYFLKAAEEMSPDGHFNLGTMYRDGRGVPKDLRKALMHFAIAATLGQPRGMWVLGKGYFYRQSWLNKISISDFHENEEVVEIYGKKKKKNVIITATIKKNEIVLLVNQRKPYLVQNVTFPIMRDVKIALKYFRTLSELGSSTASNVSSLALKAWLDGHHEEASLLYAEAASMGIVDALSNIAWIQRSKQNTLTDIESQDSFSLNGKWSQERIAHFYTAAAAAEASVEDLLILGKAYEDVKMKREIVPKIYEFASQHGSQEAMFRLGVAELENSNMTSAIIHVS